MAWREGPTGVREQGMYTMGSPGTWEACAAKAEGGIDVVGRTRRMLAASEMEVWPSGAALQGEAPNHGELRRLRAGVVSVAGKAHQQCVRYELRRRTRVNH